MMKNLGLKAIGAAMMQALGLHYVLRYINRDKAAVLLYHSVARDDVEPLPPWAIRQSEFRWQMSYLARHHRVLPLPYYVELLLKRQPIPPHSVVITFDDGFRDNYTVAYPILKEFGLPATIFLVTGYLDTEQALWPDVLFQAIYRTNVQWLDLRHLGDGTHWLRSLTERQRAFTRLIEYMKTLPVDQKNRWLSEIARRLNVDLSALSDADAPYAMLRKHEIQQMAQEGLITFGVHTESHEILTRFPFERAKQEIQISKQKLEALLGQPARFFAYPNGTEADFNEALKRELRAQGFTCAFASVGGFVSPQYDRFALQRVGIGPESSRAYFKMKLAGAMQPWYQLRRLLRRTWQT